MKKEKIKEFIEKNITKIIFTIEFITSILLSVLMLKIFATKYYSGYWSLKYLLESIPVAIILIGCIIKNIMVNKKVIEKLWIGFLIPVGMLFLIFIIPTYAPDEQAHLWKSYEISTGKLITQLNEDGSYPTTIPKFYNENVIPKLAKYNQLFEKTNLFTDYNSTIEVSNPASSYFPAFYGLSSIGIFIGRLFNLNGIYTEYIARLMNYIIYLVLGYYSIKKIPFGKMAVGVLLFMPMCLQQGTSMSIDCLINALSIFFISYTLYLKYKEEKLKLHEKIIYICVSMLLGVAKFVYIPICCLSLLVLTNKKMEKKEKIILVVGTILLSVVAAGIWYKISSSYIDNRSYLVENNVNFGEQIKFAIQHPKEFMGVIFGDAIDSSEGYLYGSVGENLGWLNINIPHIKITFIIFLFILAIFFEDNKYELKKLEKVYTMLVAIAVYLLVIVALYCGWSSVGGEKVMGVQGRYFIPVLILPILCLARKNNYIKTKNFQIVLPILLTIVDITVIKNIFKFFI